MSVNAPSAIALSRQNLPLFKETGKGALRGGYILKDGGANPDVILIATGSEVELAMNAAEELGKENISARVVSMPCVELFEEQDAAYRESVPVSYTHLDVYKRQYLYGGGKYHSR